MVGLRVMLVVIAVFLQDLHRVKGLLELGLQEKNIWLSQERKMCCGMGKCGHCRIGARYVCLDGPVFNYIESKDMLD